MTYGLDDLKLPPHLLRTRKDNGWDRMEQGQEHRVAVLEALKEATVRFLVARYLAGGPAADNDDDFHREFVGPLWDELRDCLTRQDLLRWLIDWAAVQARPEAFRQIMQLQDDLDSLDDEPGELTENPS